MRKTILGLLAVVAVAFMVASPANAGHKLRKIDSRVAVGAVVGTVVGVGLYNGWFNGSVNGLIISTSAKGAAAAGFVIGVGTIALLHAATEPCVGFHALFAGKGCKNGRYVGPKRQAFLW